VFLEILLSDPDVSIIEPSFSNLEFYELVARIREAFGEFNMLRLLYT
jgi:hypothetical protein